MSSAKPDTRIDTRFSDPESGPTAWSDTVRVLEEAELYWLTTVRGDGRPHVTPLVGVWDQEAAHFCTGPGEQKFRNLESNPQVALTTGRNAWAAGLDVVVEGRAVRVADQESLRRLAGAYESKYGSVWHFDIGEGVFATGENVAVVFRIEMDKVIAFAKDPHGQTTYRLPAAH